MAPLVGYWDSQYLKSIICTHCCFKLAPFFFCFSGVNLEPPQHDILGLLPLLTTTSHFSHSGEIKDGKFLLDWLSDDENRELVDEIEHVNPAMLDQLVAQSTYLAALFCEYFPKINTNLFLRNDVLVAASHQPL